MNATTLPASAIAPMPFLPAPYGCRLEDIPADLRTWDGWSPAECIDITAPAGWYSVAHWAALTEWGVFESFEQPMEEVLAEWLGEPWQVEAERLAAAEGVAPIVWPAPSKIAAAGFPTMLLFPDAIVREVFRL